MAGRPNGSIWKYRKRVRGVLKLCRSDTLRHIEAQGGGSNVVKSRDVFYFSSKSARLSTYLLYYLPSPLNIVLPSTHKRTIISFCLFLRGWRVYDVVCAREYRFGTCGRVCREAEGRRLITERVLDYGSLGGARVSR